MTNFKVPTHFRGKKISTEGKKNYRNLPLGWYDESKENLENEVNSTEKILKLKKIISKTHPGLVYRVSSSPEGKYLATVRYENNLKIFEINYDRKEKIK